MTLFRTAARFRCWFRSVVTTIASSYTSIPVSPRWHNTILMAFSLGLINLVAVWFETVFYGPYIVLFLFTTHAIYRQSLETKRTSRTLLATCLLLAFFSTLHVICSLQMLIEAVLAGESIPGGTTAYFNNEGSSLAILRKGIFAVSVLVAEILMIYRCYVLWNRTAWVIVFPLLALCGIVISASFITKELMSYKPAPQTGIFTSQFVLWVPIFFAISFVNSVYLASFMAFKLWNASRMAHNDMLKFKRKFATIIIVESNSIYPLMNLVALIFFIAENDIQVIPVNLLAQVVVIAPTLMILQVQKGLYSPHSRSRLGISSESLKVTKYDVSELEHEDFQGFSTPYAFMAQRRTSCQAEGGVSYTTYGGMYPLIHRGFAESV